MQVQTLQEKLLFFLQEHGSSAAARPIFSRGNNTILGWNLGKLKE